MTDKEKILEILKKANITIFVNNSDYIEVENGYMGENISFEFNETGKLLSINS